MKDIKDKLKKTLEQKPEVKPKISEWRGEDLDESLHVKYDPSSKNASFHLDAIFADVNESSQCVEEDLNREHELKKLAVQNLDILKELGDIGFGLSFGSNEDARKEKSHREELKRQREMASKAPETKGVRE